MNSYKDKNHTADIKVSCVVFLFAPPDENRLKISFFTNPYAQPSFAVLFIIKEYLIGAKEK